jgi:ABC-type multidrug transport system fused ATPase/permease subunit
MTERSINITKIMFNSILNNKTIAFSAILLLTAYYLQDIIFTRSLAKVTANVPEFMKDISLKKLAYVMAPYLLSIYFFYNSKVLTTKTLSKIELESVNTLTDDIIESIKTTKKSINVNDVMMHIKKFIDVKDLYKLVVSYITPTIIVSLTFIYNMFMSDFKSGILVTLLLLALILVTGILEYNNLKGAHASEVCFNSFYEEIHEVLGNIDTVLTSDTKDKEMDNIDEVTKKTYKTKCAADLKGSNTTYSLIALTMFAMLGLNYISYKLYKSDKIDSSVFVSNVLLSVLFMDYYDYTVRAVMEVITDIGRFTELNEFFGQFKLIDEECHKSDETIIIKKNNTLNVSKGNVSFRNITLKYEDKVIFDDFNIDIIGNKITGLVGPIGCGKSSLVKMMARIINYDGNIYIDDQNVNEYTYEAITKNIAYISQHPKLFNRSIMYNINYGTTYEEKDIYKTLEELGLKEFFMQFPDKLNTIVGKEGSKLSGGQRQFVTLVRSVLQNKKIFLLDEPTSSLDDKSKNLFIDVLKKIKNRTIIVITHDKDIYPAFDVIINIDDEKNKKNKKNTSKEKSDKSSTNTIENNATDTTTSSSNKSKNKSKNKVQKMYKAYHE